MVGTNPTIQQEAVPNYIVRTGIRHYYTVLIHQRFGRSLRGEIEGDIEISREVFGNSLDKLSKGVSE